MGILGVEYILGLECMYLGNLTVQIAFKVCNPIRAIPITTHLIYELEINCSISCSDPYHH